MSGHPRVELLSIYLDNELGARRQRQLESHLEICDECRVRLHRLESVVRDLRNLERRNPPPQIGLDLLSLVAVAPVREPSLLERLEQQVSRWTVHGFLLPLFAVVMALVLMTYLFSMSLVRREQATIPVRLDPPRPTAESVEPPLPSAGILTVAGREFIYLDGVWVEEGLRGTTTFERREAADPVVARLLGEHPQLRDLVDQGKRVRLSIDELAIEIEP